MKSKNMEVENIPKPEDGPITKTESVTEATIRVFIDEDGNEVTETVSKTTARTKSSAGPNSTGFSESKV